LAGSIGRGIVKKNGKWRAPWIGCFQLNPVVVPGDTLRLTLDGSAAKGNDATWLARLARHLGCNRVGLAARALDFSYGFSM
jgi:hypothetical protein